jgi:hypothetical protein
LPNIRCKNVEGQQSEVKLGISPNAVVLAARDSGQVALNKKNPAAALNALQAAFPLEFGQIGFVNNISCLYHVNVRGEA